jgi:hypothetical protein
MGARCLELLVSALVIAAACEPADSPPGQRASRSCRVQGVPRARPEVRAVAFAYGKGPVFVGLGTGNGRVRYTEDTRQHDGWYYYKTLWAVDPGYTGAVVITGEEIDGSNELRFNTGGFPGTKQTRLRFPPDDSGWRFGPSDTLIRAPGCYAFELEGDGFSETIEFKAVR